MVSMSGGLENGSIESSLNGRIERTGTNIVRREKGEGEEEKRRKGVSGLLGKARGGKWSLSA